MGISQGNLHLHLMRWRRIQLCLTSYLQAGAFKVSHISRIGIIIVHYPPYCSKYNPIEHRLFAHITRTWSGIPLLSAEYACKKANETTTSKGLVVVASINSKEYQTQRTLDESYVSERQKRIIFDEQLPKWNYVVRCKSA